MDKQKHVFLRPCELITSTQYEGYSYLGIGMLLFLLIICIVVLVESKKGILRVIRKIWKEQRLFWPILVLVVGFVGFAASPMITFGRHFFVLPTCRSLVKIWSIFRSTGRMIWPIWYLIVWAVLTGWYLLMRKKRGILYGVTVVLLILQIIDFTPLIQTRAVNTQADLKYQEQTLTSQAWDEIGQSYRHMVLYPDTINYMYWCNTPFYFHMYALKYHLTMNTTYFSRDISETVDAQTYEIFAQAKETGKWDADTFYVCKDGLPEYSEGLYSYVIDGVVVYLPNPLEQEYENCYYVENAYEKMMEHNKTVE